MDGCGKKTGSAHGWLDGSHRPGQRFNPATIPSDRSRNLRSTARPGARPRSFLGCDEQQGVRKKKPGRFGRDDKIFRLVLFPQRLRTGLTCDAPLALGEAQPDWLRQYKGKGEKLGAGTAVPCAPTTDNPCCDGGDSRSAGKLLLVAVPEGATVLAFEKETDDYNRDDADGDTQTVCRSEVSYERDGEGRLLAINARKSCTENGKFVPPIKASRFEWNAGEKRFLQRNGE